VLYSIDSVVFKVNESNVVLCFVVSALDVVVDEDAVTFTLSVVVIIVVVVVEFLSVVDVGSVVDDDVVSVDGLTVGSNVGFTVGNPLGI